MDLTEGANSSSGMFKSISKDRLSREDESGAIRSDSGRITRINRGGIHPMPAIRLVNSRGLTSQQFSPLNERRRRASVRHVHRLLSLFRRLLLQIRAVVLCEIAIEIGRTWGEEEESDW